MKKLELYQCELCGTKYNDKIKCENCEKSHKAPVKVVGQRYISKEFNNEGFPVSVTILFNDGQTATYER